jgi:hypothetical protein
MVPKSELSDTTKLWSVTDARELIGGIKLTVYSKYVPINLPSGMILKSSLAPSSLINLTMQTAKFTATIGQSSFTLSTDLIVLGGDLSPNVPVTAGFWINNMSSRMPLEVKLKSTSPFVAIDKHTLKIDPSVAGEVSDGRSNSVWVGLTFQCPSFGFFFEKIECINVNSSQVSEVSVRAFIDPRLISFTSLTAKDPATIEEDVISWHNLYTSFDGNIDNRPLNLVLQKKSTLDAVPAYEYSIEIHNQADELLHLQPISNLDMFVRWRVVNGSGFVLDSHQNEIPLPDVVTPILVGDNLHRRRKSFPSCGSAVMLPAHEKIIAIITAPKPGILSDEKTIQNFLSGKKINMHGILLLEDVDKCSIVKAIRVSPSYCRSRGTIEPKSIDLGKVGHFNGWQDSKFT